VDIDDFLQSLSPVSRKVAPGPIEREPSGQHDQPVSAEPLRPKESSSEPASASPAFQMAFSTDSRDMRDIARAISPVLGDNPRRLKQFINVFRLRAFISYETGLLSRRRMTPQQLGKLVAMQMRWPLRMAAIAKNPGSLLELQQNSLSLQEKLEDPDLMEFLRYEALDPASPWNLGSADFEGFLRVSPVIHTVDLDQETIVAPATAGPAVSQPAEIFRILWVDDNPSNNEAIKNRIEVEFEVVVETSRSTADALKRVGAQKFHMIISDMGRPPDNRAGYTLLSELGKKGLNIPFIIYAAGGSESKNVQEAKSRGALASTSVTKELLSFIGEFAPLQSEWPVTIHEKTDIVM
jgi:CheY-like chemotaxis protein